jgi:hypothetical protein
MNTSKKCWECKSTESEEWHKYDMPMEDPISVACSDCEMTYITETIDICDRCWTAAEEWDEPDYV